VLNRQDENPGKIRILVIRAILMDREVMAVVICLAVVGMMGNALAQQQTPVAGATTTVIGVAAGELVTVLKGWSARNQISGERRP
jgi:hypothetical protein